MGDGARRTTVFGAAMLAAVLFVAALVSSSAGAAGHSPGGKHPAHRPAAGPAPGPPPPPCAPGFVPNPGLLGASGCLLQSALAGFEISPNVAHVGDRITGTVLPGDKTDRWDWQPFIEAFAASGRRPRCSNRSASCTVTAGPQLAGAHWRVFSMAIAVPINGGNFETGVSSDYFTVEDNRYEIGGLVSDSLNRFGEPLPVGNTKVQVTGNGIDEIETTSPLGRYAFALHPGRYTVRVLGALSQRALPSRYTVTLSHNVTHADFQLNAKDHMTIAVAPIGGTPTAGNATIAGGASAVTITTTILNPNGNPRPTLIETTAPQTPKAVFCAPGQLVYPQLDTTGRPTAFNPFVQPTKPLGSATVTMYAGSSAGPFPLSQIEVIHRNAAAASTSVTLTTTARQGLQTVAQSFYNAVAALRHAPRSTASMLGIGVPSAATSPSQIVAARTAEQDVLLAFLDAHYSQIGVDFGPVFTNGAGGAAGQAGIEFYDGQNQVVMDTGTAEAIVGAATSGQPLPGADRALPSLADYVSANGPVMQGHLTPEPADALTYFGWPYPPLSPDGVIDARFFSNCVRPDTGQLRIEVDGPADALFTDPFGRRFGFTSSGAPESAATGYAFAASAGTQRTFILPVDTYTVALAGSGAGTVHLSVFVPGAASEATQVFTFAVKRGQKGSVAIGGGGAPGPLQLAGHSYSATAGMPMTLSASVRTPKTGLRTLIIRLLDAVGRPVPGAIVTATQIPKVGTQGATNNAGVALLEPAGMHAGRITIAATAPATLPAQLVYQVPPAAVRSAGTGGNRRTGHRPHPSRRGGGGAAGGGGRGGAGGRSTTSRSRPTASTLRTRR